MPDIILVLTALAAAFGSSALALVVFGWIRRQPDSPWAAAGAVLGTGLGFNLGVYLLGLWPGGSQFEGEHRLLFIVIPWVVSVELLAAIPKIPRWLIWVLRLVLAAGVTPVLLFDSVYLRESPGAEELHWSVGQTVLILGGLGVALAAVWASLDVLVRRAPGRSPAFALAVTAGATGLTIMLSGSSTTGQLALPLAAALVGIAAGSLLLPGPSRLTGPLAVGTVGLFGLLVLGHFFSELSAWHAVLLFCAPLACWLPEIPLVNRARPLLRGTGRVALVGALAGVVVFLATRPPQEDTRPPGPDRDPAIPEYNPNDYHNFGK